MKTKNRKFILCIAVGVLAVIIITFVISHMTKRDCPLTDVRVGMPYEKAISLLDKGNIDYEVIENTSFKTIMYDQNLGQINGQMMLIADMEEFNNDNINEISWVIIADTKAEHKKNLEIVVDYLIDIYGDPKEGDLELLDSFQGLTWFRNYIRVTFYSLESDVLGRIQITWDDKRHDYSK